MVVKPKKPVKRSIKKLPRKIMGKSFFHTEPKKECTKNEFSTDGKKWYKGFTFGDTWNGFASPLFTFDVAKQVLEDSIKLNNKYVPKNDQYSFKYNKGRDTFFLKFAEEHSNCDEPGSWIYEGKDIEYKGKTYHVYPIGAWEWIWESKE